MKSKESQKRQEQKKADRNKRAAPKKKKSRFEKIHVFLEELGGISKEATPSELRDMLVSVCLHSSEACHEAAALLEEFFPETTEALLGRATAFGRSNMPAHARQTYLELLERWPDSILNDDIRDVVKRIDDALREDGDTDLDLLLAQESVEIAMLDQEDFATAESLCLAALQQWPDDLRILNHFAILRLLQGRLREALEFIEGAHKRFPKDVSTMVHCVRLLLALGRKDEAHKLGEDLKLSETQPHEYHKLQEGLALLGRDPEVVQVFEAVKKLEQEDISCNHLAAVAFARQGDWERARQLWREALDDDLDDELSAENLENAELPEEERWPAWAMGWQSWLTLSQCVLLEESEREPNELLAQDSDLRIALQNLLERGCPEGVANTLAYLTLQPTGLSRQMLQSFAEGSWGPAYLRAEVAEELRVAQEL